MYSKTIPVGLVLYKYHENKIMYKTYNRSAIVKNTQDKVTEAPTFDTPKGKIRYFKTRY